MEITGKLKVKYDLQQVSDKFKKRDFVLTDDSTQYPQHILIQATQDKCGLLDSVKEGDEIKVSINIKGREWTSPQGEVKYFNSIEAWKIEKIGSNSQESAPQKNSSTPSATIPSSTFQEEDDMPF